MLFKKRKTKRSVGDTGDASGVPETSGESTSLSAWFASLFDSGGTSSHHKACDPGTPADSHHHSGHGGHDGGSHHSCASHHSCSSGHSCGSSH